MRAASAASADNAALPVAPPGFRSGYVAILGKPNAGKSTLMNALIGAKVAITSDKPQTTRDRINGILTTDRAQIVFVDTPGVMEPGPNDRFNEALLSRAADALDGVDVVYHLVDAQDRDAPNPRLVALLGRTRRARRLLVVNKVDRKALSKDGGPPVPPGIDPAAYDDLILISALKKQGLDLLLHRTVSALPEGPMYYPADQLSDRDMRFLAAEAVRERVFRRTGAEVPYSVFCEVEEYREAQEGSGGKDFVRITIHVERDSQKGILIGEGGRVLKDIGREARGSIEKMTERPCYLELHVKVKKDWRKRDFDLNLFGFKPGKKKKPGRG